MARILLSELGTVAPKEFVKTQTKQELKDILEELDELQNMLYAENKHSILVILQGMDASGKDGLIKKVFGSLNPHGISVTSYKVPTEEEYAHDFLWRIHKNAPASGHIKIFNRSQYEDVLVTRVHNMIDDELAYKRMKAINDFEELLTKHNNTHILKFYLHVSEEEQQERLKERMHVPRKMWKYNKRDFIEAAHREQYYKCYEDVFEHCNNIPWHIVPADQNWYKAYHVAKVLRDTLLSLNMKYPGIEG